MPSSHLILCHPLFLLPPIPPSIRVFSNESTLLMRWPKYWSFSFSIIPSKEIPGLISFRMDWLDLLLRLNYSVISCLCDLRSLDPSLFSSLPAIPSFTTSTSPLLLPTLSLASSIPSYYLQPHLLCQTLILDELYHMSLYFNNF